ncbi:unnamed protein product [marine sediment metagenome]|uniref:Uncharacterized protein n=1 Tax=marine sediment metagenome TaxID=412755 RepID=X1HTM8_9ZZZZ
MEGKTIWLRPETKERLDALRGKGETFDQVVERLCSVFETIRAIPDTLGPQHPVGGGRLPDYNTIRENRSGG